MVEAEAAASKPGPDAAPPPTPGAALAAAALGQPAPDVPPAQTVSNRAIPTAEAERVAENADPPAADS